VNCRIFPGEDPAGVRKTLERVVADPRVSVSDVALRAADGSLVRLVTVPPSPLLPEVTQAMGKTVHQMYGNIPIMATMSTGATDGRITRTAGIPTYGISCMFFQMNDNRAHGKDERVGVQDFCDGITFNYNLIRALSSAN
jgi:acetylornithine deacetylase/succinyl-diaminopimelate desuccinylase-like protein